MWDENWWRDGSARGERKAGAVVIEEANRGWSVNVGSDASPGEEIAQGQDGSN